MLATRSARALLAALLTLVVAAGCSDTQGGQPDATAGAGAGTASSPAPTPAKVTVTPADGTRDVMPDAPVRVKAESGRITTVTVRSKDGHTVDGTLEDGQWTSTARLTPAAAYTVTVAAAGSDGATTTTTSTFTVHKPKVTATYHLVYDGQTVGTGMPVSVQFDSAVDPTMRGEVEKRVSVTSSPAQEGAWGWLDARQLMWRPKVHWKPGTTVTVDAPLTGVQTGTDKWVGTDASGGFTVGSQTSAHVDIARHTMTVSKDGKVLRTIPVSSGKPGPETETRSGTKVVIGKEPEITMDSATVGIPKGSPGYYKVDTKWNVRVTWTGEFLHSAPWSVGAQGNSNVSHGCINMAPANAEWVFSTLKAGDVVTFDGSGRTFRPDEGIGVWQYSWAGWQKQSALR